MRNLYASWSELWYISCRLISCDYPINVVGNAFSFNKGIVFEDFPITADPELYLKETSKFNMRYIFEIWRRSLYALKQISGFYLC